MNNPRSSDSSTIIFISSKTDISFCTSSINRGHGLLLVKHIVGNNNIFETKTDIINGLYIQTVTITKVLPKKPTKKKPSTK